MMVLSLFIIGHMGLFFYNKIGSIISIVDLPTTNIIEPELPNTGSASSAALASLGLVVATSGFALLGRKARRRK